MSSLSNGPTFEDATIVTIEHGMAIGPRYQADVFFAMKDGDRCCNGHTTEYEARNHAHEQVYSGRWPWPGMAQATPPAESPEGIIPDVDYTTEDETQQTNTEPAPVAHRGAARQEGAPEGD